jgi:ABC-type spermidine/putrescine transport system permease subunit II
MFSGLPIQTQLNLPADDLTRLSPQTLLIAVCTVVYAVAAATLYRHMLAQRKKKLKQE